MMQARSFLVLLSMSLGHVANGSMADMIAFEALMSRSEQDFVDIEDKISIDMEDIYGRSLVAEEYESKERCWSTENERHPNRYCIFDETPREGTFLMLSCPDTKDDLSRCQCTIGVGDPEEGPNTRTCLKCGFCSDGKLAFDCRNVADGTCIGMNCRGECVSSLVEEDIFASAATVGASLISIFVMTSATLF